MRNSFIALLLSLAFSTSIYAEDNVLTYKTDVEVDGINNEWGTPLPKYNKNTCINYNVVNDERNIYFILRIADEAILKQITQNGLEVWVNKDGKKKKVTGVTFPLPMSKNSKDGKAGRQGQNISSEKNVPEGSISIQPKQEQGVYRPSNELILTGFLLDNGKQPTKGCPVRVAALMDNSNSLVYELAIPFNTFYKERLDETDAKAKFYIGFIVKGEATSESSEMGGRMGMGGMGGPGGMDGGGMMGGRGSMGGAGGMGMSSSTSTDKEFWFKTSLFTQNIKK